MVPRACLSLVVLTAALFHPVAAWCDEVADVLSANRAARGPASGPATLRTTYRYSGQGLTGTVTTRADAASGAYVTESDLGVIVVGDGYDGQAPWMRDVSGAFTEQKGGDRQRLAVNQAYRHANLWWRDDRGGAAIAYVDRRTVDGVTYHRLSVTPRDGAPFTAWFDARTGLLAQIEERQMFFDTRTFYRDYVRRGDDLVPSQVVMDGGTGEASYATLQLVEALRTPARAASDYARPQTPPSGVTIAGARRAVTLPFRLLNNHIYVEGKVNGHGPYTFIVDTGGHTLLSSRVVREVGLRTAGAAPAAGAGSAVATSGYAKVKSITFGPIAMQDQTAFILDIYDPAVEGIRVDGMVGFELLRRLAVKIDYGAKTLTFTRFEDFDAKAAGAAIPFVFYDHLPQIPGAIDGLPALLDIDTGSRSEIDVTSPYVAAHGLRERFPKAITAMTGWGVGGPSMSQVARAASVSLGPVEVKAPVVSLSSATRGSFSDANYAGNVGSGLLKRFVASFNYATQTMYLKPIVPAPQDAGTFDRSGMWLNAGEKGFVVTYVSPGGPADEAGLRLKDVVVAINGRPARAADLSTVRMVLRTKPDGARIDLTVLRGGQRRPVRLILKDRL